MAHSIKYLLVTVTLTSASVAHAQPAPTREVERRPLQPLPQQSAVQSATQPTAPAAASSPAAPATLTPPVAAAPEAQQSPASASGPVPVLPAASSPPPNPPTQPSQPSVGEANSPPEAPPPSVRHGFYLRAAFGSGFAQLTGTGPQGNVSLRGLGSLTTVAIGGSIAPGVVLAGTIQGSTVNATFKGGPFRNQTVTTADGRTVDASDKAQVSAAQLGLLVDWYPKPASGWHLGMSAGLGLVSLVNEAARAGTTDSTMVGTSTSGSIFGGYDWYLGKDWSMGLALSAMGTTSASMKDKDGNDTGYHLKSLSVGLDWSLLYF